MLCAFASPKSYAQGESLAFKPEAQQVFPVLLNFLNVNANTDFMSYDERVRNTYEGDIANYINYAQDYEQKFIRLSENLGHYTEEDLRYFLEELSNEFTVVEAVVTEHLRKKDRNPNQPENPALTDFIKMFVLIIETLEASVNNDDLLDDLRLRVQAVKEQTEAW